MFLFGARLLHDFAQAGDDDGVCGDEEGGFAFLRVVDFRGVDVLRLLQGCGEDIFYAGGRFGQVFGEGGGDYVEVGEADL